MQTPKGPAVLQNIFLCYTSRMERTSDIKIKGKQDFTQGSIAGKMVAFMLPILLSLVLQSLYGAVDMLIVGRFGTTAGISGVAVISAIYAQEDIRKASEDLKKVVEGIV